MDALFGTSMPLAARFFIAFLVVLALIGVTAWLVRRFGSNRLGAAARGRQPRLAVIDAASVDGRRRLVLIRRDNTEHLLMIGGPTDVVIEPNIVRASGARDTAREPARTSLSDVARSVPPEPAWPAPPVAAEPPPPPSPLSAPARSQRTPASEEPWLPPEPGGRARPAADSLSGLAAELSAKLHAPEAVPPPRHEPPRHEAPRQEAPRHEPPQRHEPPPPRTVAPSVSPEPPAPAPVQAAPAQNDHNLAEMAQQLEAALRRTPAPEARPPVTDPLAMTSPAKPTPPRSGAPRDFKVKTEAKFDAKRDPKFEPAERRPDQRDAKFDPKFDAKPEPRFDFRPDAKPEPATASSKTIYDNLEEEMASLLGRPPDKS